MLAAAGAVVLLLVAALALVASKQSEELPVLSGLVAERTSEVVALSWDAVPAAAGYRVTRLSEVPQRWKADTFVVVDEEPEDLANYVVFALDYDGEAITEGALVKTPARISATEQDATTTPPSPPTASVAPSVGCTGLAPVECQLVRFLPPDVADVTDCASQAAAVTSRTGDNPAVNVFATRFATAADMAERSTASPPSRRPRPGRTARDRPGAGSGGASRRTRTSGARSAKPTRASHASSGPTQTTPSC